MKISLFCDTYIKQKSDFDKKNVIYEKNEI